MRIRISKQANSEIGQSTVEFAIVSLITVGAVIALWTSVQAVRGDAVRRHITGNASHTISADHAGGLVLDVFAH